MLIEYDTLQLPVARLCFYFKAVTPIFLPEYTGSTFRGSFGASFKKICCTKTHKNDCTGCSFLDDCAYAKIFETPQTGQANIQATNLPHPFVIEPPLFNGRQTVEPGEMLQCDMVLIGQGINHLYHFILVWIEMGKQGLGKGRGRFTLERVTNEKDETTYQAPSGLLKKNLVEKNLQNFNELKSPLTVTLKIQTPIRITELGQLCRALSFKLFLRNLLRRASLLAQIHTPQIWRLDYKAILAAAATVKTAHSNLRWWDWERYSNRQQQRMQMGGLVGDITFEGELKSYWPLLQFGTYLHVGKNTTFGMGKYIIQNL